MYSCDVCSRTFREKNNLTRRKSGQDQEKKFGFGKCSKTFNNDRHKQVECKVCLREMRSDRLKRHMRRKDHTVTLNEENNRVRRLHKQLLEKQKVDGQEYIEVEEPFDKFEFESFITGHYHYRHIWTPKVAEELTTSPEVGNKYDEFAVSVLKNNDTIVGHIPQQISKEITTLLKSGGTVKAKVIAKPLNTRVWGIRVPCIYNVIGKRKHLQDIKDNIIIIF